MELKNLREIDVAVIGAGPAGLGVSIALERLGINYMIIEKNTLGHSFKNWPKETRLISPSFTGNFFGMPDLNSISPDSSPAYSLLSEHPTGKSYASYLDLVSKYYELKILENTEVLKLEKTNDFYHVHTTSHTIKSKYVIWAAGEFQYPNLNAFKGAEHCVHYSQVDAFKKLHGNERVVIGAYEAGFDAAINLTKLGHHITLLDSTNYLDIVDSDSSYALSPFTRDRIKNVIDKIAYKRDTKVTSVEHIDGDFVVTLSDNTHLKTKNKPINCTGFASSLTLVESFFEFDGHYPLLNDFDESIKENNLFLVGPQVKHSSALFCFIYKYRQRFAIVAKEIATRIGLPEEVIMEVVNDYVDNNFYLEDLSCCDNQCSC